MIEYDSGPENIKHIETADSPERRVAYKVAIFGTGSEGSIEDKVAMENARKIAERVVENGFGIVTGGYDGGVMKAASEGGVAAAQKIGKENTAEFVKAFPLTEKYLNQAAVQGAKITRSETLPERLEHLIDESEAFVVLGGKFGTVVELITTLHSESVRRMPQEKPSPRPIIIVDSTLQHLDTLNFMLDRDKKLQRSSALEHTYFLTGNESSSVEAKRIVEDYYQQSLGKELGEDERQYLAQASYRHNYDNHISQLREGGFSL